MKKDFERQKFRRLNYYKENYEAINYNLSQINEKYLTPKLKNEEKKKIESKVHKQIKRKSNKIKNEKNNIYNKKIYFINIKHILFFQFIILFFSISLTKEKVLTIRKLNNYITQIEITTINIGGDQDILYQHFPSSPYEVLVNGNIQNSPGKKVYNLPIKENIITMKFDFQINNCEKMFSNLANIKSIDLSRFDASKVTTMKNMFKACTNLESINLENIDTSSLEIMDDLFNDCWKLSSLDLSYFDTSSVISMFYMFYNCKSLKFLDLSKFNTSKVIYMNSTFHGCTSLISINLESFNTKSAISMDNMFNNCKSLVSINLSSFDTSSVVSMSNMFLECNALTSLDISNFQTSKVENMDSMFRSCTQLKSLNLSNFDTSSVTSMKYMFSYCDKLEYLNLDHFNTFKTKIMKYMFINCKNLLSLDLSSFNTQSVIEMMYMFSGCEKLQSLNLENFDGSSVETTEYMFYGCKKLSSLKLSNFKATSAKTMQNMFEGCEELTELNLSNFQTNNVRNISSMFYNCIHLKTLDISNFITSSITNMQYIFSGCQNLVSLDVSNFNLTSCVRLDNMFSNLKSLIFLNLNSIVIGNNNPNTTDIFKDLSSYYKYCIRQELSDILKWFLKKDSECSDNCFKNNRKLIIENKVCTLSCKYNNDYKYEYNNICYNNCPEKTHSSANDKFLCEKDLECKKYYNLNKTICYDEIEEGFYLKYPINKILDRCHSDCKTCDKGETIDSKNCKTCPSGKYLNFGNCVDSCKNGYDTDEFGNNFCRCSLNNKCKDCTKESSNLDLCITCNDGFYKILNDITNRGRFINCYKDPEGYYLDLENKVYKPCYESCKTCRGGGNSEINNCEECKENFTFLDDFENDKNCYPKCQNYYYFNELNKYKCTQNDTCPEKQSKLISVKKKCIDECKYDNIYKNEYNNECHINCPDGKLPINNICPKELESTLIEKELENTLIEKELESTLIEKELESTLIEKELESTLIEKELESTQIEKVSKSENIKETEEKIEVTFPQEYESELIINFSALDLFITKSCGSEISSPKNKDQIISNIKNDIMNNKINDLLNNITQKKEDLVIQEKDTIYQITTTDNQNNNEYKNISTVKLGDCEDRLKNIYGIHANQSLIIFKIDYYSPGLLIPIIGYEIFHPENKSKLDLNYCKDILIELNIPVTIDEENLFKYDPNSEYYKDECIPSTTENGTDIILNDRQNEYNTNNLSLCQNNCTFSGYDTETKKAICDCEIKTKINLISEIIEDKNILSGNNFTSNDDSSSNVITMKCIYTLFTKEGLKSNIGSYILILIIALFSISSILFYKIGYVMLENDIKKIIKEKEKTNNKNNLSIYKYKEKSSKKNKTSKTERKKSKSIIMSKTMIPNKSRPKSKSKNLENKMIQNNKKEKKSKDKKNFPPRKKSSGGTNRCLKKEKTNEVISQSKLKLKEVKILLNFQKRRKTKQHKSSKSFKILDEKIEVINNLVFNDFELNTFTYKEALMYDKRTYTQYYISLIKFKHPIIFSFIPVRDYNTMIIKVCLFFESFCIYYAVNALFFNEMTIHKIYEGGGSYNLSYFLPQIIYSFFISHFLSSIIKYVFLSERNIIEIKKEKILEEAINKVERVKRDLIIKYITFFVLGILFLIFFWYYLSSFCAVFQNSQIFLIKNAVISFVISFLYPFGINLIPGIFRIPSLKNKKEEISYKISIFIQLI